jgi:hypothetical protein
MLTIICRFEIFTQLSLSAKLIKNLLNSSIRKFTLLIRNPSRMLYRWNRNLNISGGSQRLVLLLSPHWVMGLNSINTTQVLENPPQRGLFGTIIAYTILVEVEDDCPRKTR